VGRNRDLITNTATKISIIQSSAGNPPEETNNNPRRSPEQIPKISGLNPGGTVTVPYSQRKP